MKLSDFARTILEGNTLESKLLDADSIDFDSIQYEVPTRPNRSNKIAFSKKQSRFPKGDFHLVEKRARALNAFANHELLATEIMACALLIFPHNTDELKRFKRGIIKSLTDEQKHFSLYTNRMNDLGFEFGDFPLNDFLWKHIHQIKTPSEYLAIMALTFEAANLDFAHFYENVFREHGDIKSANILKVVYDDEISHVGFGVNYLNLWKQDKTLWEYYTEVLPFPLTPARSKGNLFVEEARVKSKMDADFIKNVKDYRSDFNVINRKGWS